MSDVDAFDLSPLTRASYDAQSICSKAVQRQGRVCYPESGNSYQLSPGSRLLLRPTESGSRCQCLSLLWGHVKSQTLTRYVLATGRFGTSK